MGIFQQFPYSNFHEMNLDQIIKIMRQMQDEWAATKTEWDSYKDFIDNYFENLDVSEEVLSALRIFASDGTLAEITNPQIATSVTEWLNQHITPTTPAIDTSLTVSGAGADAKVTGNWIFPFMDDQPFDDYVDEVLDNGFWSTNNGQKYASENLKSSRSLIRVVSGGFYLCNYDIDYCMYDINKVFLGQRHMYTKTTLFADDVKPTTIRDDVAYIGINVPVSATKIEIHRLDTSKIDNILTPFDNDNYLYKDDYWTNGTGTLHPNTSLSTIMCANLEIGSKWYVNNTAGVQCVCIDTRGNALTVDKVFDAYSNGNIFTIPENTKLTYFNIYNNHTDASGTTGSIKTDYITKITQPKKLLTLGDSVTWIDGTSASSTVGKMAGYQRELREMGYEVDKRAWSGYSFTNDVNTTDPTKSIYHEIVTNELDVTGYEYITLFGGLNDMLYDAPIGTTPNDYSTTDYNGDTMCGAISGILQYIRNQNPTAKIIVVNPPKSEALSRYFTKAKSYVDAINACAEFWDCPIVDLFNDMNVSPFRNFTTFFYDVTHPNYYGMRRIGTLIANKIKELYNGLAH